MLIEKFDFISPNSFIYYLGKNKHSSIFSGIVSIFILIICFILSIFLSLDFLLRKNPNINYAKTYGVDKEILFSKNSLFPYLTFLDGNNNIIELDKKIHYVIGAINITRDDEILKPFEHSHWIYDKCEGNLSDYVKNIEVDINDNNIFKKSYCIKYYYNHIDKKIYNINSNNFVYPIISSYDQFRIYFNKCLNDSILNNNSCFYDESEFLFYNNNKYVTLNVSINYFNIFLDIQNYKNSYKLKVNHCFDSFYYFYPKYKELFIEEIQINTDDGILFNNHKIENIYKIVDKDTYNIKLEYYFKSDFNLGIIIFESNNQKEIYYRNYKKFQDIAGNLSGFLKILISIINNIFYYFFYKFQLINDFNNIIYIKKDIFNKKKEKIIFDNFSIILKKRENLFDDKESKILKNNYLINNKNNNNSTINLPILSKNNIKNLNSFTIENCIMNYKKIKFLDNIKYFFNIKNYKTNYMKEIIKLRKSILSEEEIFTYHIFMKKIKQFYFDNIKNT